MNARARDEYRDTVIDAVRGAGVVGQGGAGFPTHVKLAAAAEVVIANGCECEPLLATDLRIMEDRLDLVLDGLFAVIRAAGAGRGVFALKAKHASLVRTLRERLDGTAVSLLALDDFYPAGDEQVLVHAATGRSVPPLSLPKEVGCLVANVGTLSSIAMALQGVSVTDRTITVTGEVARPSVFSAPVGTPVTRCITHCGGAAVRDYVVILGGPVMGTVLDDPAAIEAAVVTKTLGGIIVLPRGHYLHGAARKPVETMRRLAAAACIQCRCCTEMCPRYLIGHPFETHRVMRAFAAGQELTQEAAVQARMCCGCGVCEHVACPMGLSPCSINTMIKTALAREDISYSGNTDIVAGQLEWNRYRRTASARLLARTGLAPYQNIVPEPAENLIPDEVAIPLRQHIGAPALPVCRKGAVVARGDLIGEIPGNALGARVHASMDGVVQRINESVVIRRSGA